MTRLAGLGGGIALALSLAWTPSTQARAGRISGVVIADGGPEHGEPLPGVTVSLTNRTQAQNTATDERGEFTFNDLVPGRYRITTMRLKDYAGEELGAFSSGGEGTPVEVESTHSVVHAMALMRYLSTIRGTVLREDGSPAAGIRILPRPLVAIHPDAPRWANEVTTNLAGEFTAPGAYRGEMVITAIDENPLRPARTVTYFPGTADPDRAARLTIRAGEERELPPMRIARLDARVAGIVTLPDGAPAPSAPITIQNTFDNVTEATTDATGRFDVPVAAGNYQVIAQYQERLAQAPGRVLPIVPVAALWMNARVVAAPGQTARTALALKPVPSFAGLVTPESQDGSVADVNVVLSLRGTTKAMVRTEDGKFDFDRVIPGEYGVTVQIGQDSPWWLKSATVNGRSLFRGAVVLDPAQRVMNAVLTVSRDRGELSGLLSGRNNLPQTEYWVAVAPTDESVWQPESPQILRTRPATNGRFLFERLPAGEYALAVFGDLGPGEWRTRAILTSLVAGGIKVTVTPGTPVVQNVRVER